MPLQISLFIVVVVPASGQEQIDTVGSLIQALDDDDDRVRAGAVEALGIISDTRSVEPLILALNDNDSKVRSNAAKALGTIRDPRAIEPIALDLEDNDSGIRLMQHRL